MGIRQSAKGIWNKFHRGHRSLGGGQVRRPVSLHLEQLEQRMVMDGAGFEHTDPPEDPDTIVGVAEISSLDDYLETRRGTVQLRLEPLKNDLVPEGSESIHIKSVSATKLGHAVTISEDGQSLIYDAGEDGLQAGDTFYYIVESNDGKLGKANVTVSLESEVGGNYRPPPRPRREMHDFFSFFEDAPERQLNVLHNDREFRDGEIVSVEFANRYLNETQPRGSIRIAEDGKSLFYQPANGFTGSEGYQYTVRNEDGEEAIVSVTIQVTKPVRGVSRLRDDLFLDEGTGSVVSEKLYSVLSPTPQAPFLESIDGPEYAGEFSVTPDGERITYKPAPDFIGSFTLTYKVRYGSAEYQFITDTIQYHVQESFLAVDNWFTVLPDTENTNLDVLENDPTWERNLGVGFRRRVGPVGLRIASVSAGDQGGSISIAPDGKSIQYQPAAGFTGDETFTYEVLASNGVRDSATVTVHVADSVVDPSGVDRFANEAELQQFLIDKAVARYRLQFGTYGIRYAPGGSGDYLLPHVLAHDSATFTIATLRHSETNVQVAGVDEADIVETDGRYVYTFSNGELVIVDVSEPTTPKPVSFTEFEHAFDLMYLQGDRMTLLRKGSVSDGGAQVVVLDISDRTAPAVVERTEIDGFIADSRAIDDRVHLVVKRSFLLPELEGEWIKEPLPPEESHLGEPGVWRNETLDEYIERVRDSLIDTGLPSFRAYNGSGELIESGLLTEATGVHKPVAGSDLLVSLVSFDAGDNEAGPLASATSFVADSNTEVFVSAESAYVFAYDPRSASSNVYKLGFQVDGTLPIVATGNVGGKLLNQFSADEHDGYLRVATTEVRVANSQTNWWSRNQQQRFNNVVVLEQVGNELVMVGEVTNLAPTETIHSVRFMGDRAYVVTFRVVDPLFALDMSDPTNPTVEGALKIPGFSNYLHPVGSDYLIGIGRDANEITGRVGDLQITLFNVRDLSDPHVADQLTFKGTNWVDSEAWFEHHAVSYFAESGVLAIPINWSERVQWEGEEAEKFGGFKTEHHSAIWAFQVDVDDPESPTIKALGKVEHEAQSYHRSSPWGWSVIDLWWGGTYDPGSPARRALRVGESLITVSNEYIKINNLLDPSVELSELFLGKLTQDDLFTIQEDSGVNVLDVLANDFTDPGKGPSRITSFTQPTEGGTVALSDDGQALTLTPDENYIANIWFTYTTFDEVRGEETATVRVDIENVDDAPTAVDDIFSAAVNSEPIILDVLSNDINHDIRSYDFSIVDSSLTNAHLHYSYVSTRPVHLSHLEYTQNYALKIIDFTNPDQGGIVELNELGQLVYTPAEGFEGFETFSYVIETSAGLTDIGQVTIKVGEPPEPRVVLGPKEDDPGNKFANLPPMGPFPVYFSTDESDIPTEVPSVLEAGSTIGSDKSSQEFISKAENGVETLGGFLESPFVGPIMHQREAVIEDNSDSPLLEAIVEDLSSTRRTFEQDSEPNDYVFELADVEEAADSDFDMRSALHEILAERSMGD